MQHTGRAVVFESIEDLHGRINDDALDIDETCVMVLKYCGPKGYPGMAEVGNMPLPPKLLKRGINDIVRISDARMSGTAYGTVVLHAAPEAAAGGPLALVQNGDQITLDVDQRSLHLHVEDAELARRRAAWKPRRPTPLAVTSSCTSTTCCRPTTAQTWTSWWARAAPPWAATITECVAAKWTRAPAVRRHGATLGKKLVFFLEKRQLLSGVHRVRGRLEKAPGQRRCAIMHRRHLLHQHVAAGPRSVGLDRAVVKICQERPVLLAD